MTLRTRLTLSTLLGILLLAGLSLSFYLMLPDLADELLRRDAETRLDEGAGELPEALRALAEPAQTALRALIEDGELLALAREREGQEAAPWDLARDLAARYGLSSLVLLDGTGRLLSLHPDAARVGMNDPAALALARAALQRPVFAEGGATDPALVTRLALAEILEGGSLLALTFHPIRRTDIERIASRFGARVRQLSSGSQALPPGEPDTRTVHLSGADAQRVCSVILEGEENRSLVIQRLLLRGILLLSLPWLLGGAFLLVWIGWPKRETKDG